jgi:hypothetical protein
MEATYVARLTADVPTLQWTDACVADHNEASWTAHEAEVLGAVMLAIGYFIGVGLPVEEAEMLAKKIARQWCD